MKKKDKKMRSFKVFSLIVGSLYFFQTFQVSASEFNDKTVLASVNGEKITLGHVVSFQRALSDQYKSMEDSALFEAILRQLIQQEILSQEVDLNLKKNKYGLENNARAFLSNELIKKFSEAEVSESEVKYLYAKFVENFINYTEYNASHILLSTESKAIEILNELKNGSSFSNLAKVYSIGPSGKQGGSLGWFGQGAMVPTFEEAVFRLEVNQVSEPIKTDFGWHIIKLNDVREIKAPSLEEVTDELILTARQNRVEKEINKIISSANVVYSELEINHKIIRNEKLLDN